MGRFEEEAQQGIDAGFPTVTLEQRGPDGTEILMLLIFYVCPLCAATVAPAEDEDPMRLAKVHAEWHLQQARALDQITAPAPDTSED